jgi:hypothetical protein
MCSIQDSGTGNVGRKPPGIFAARPDCRTRQCNRASHWAIENAFHHVHDVALREDASHIREQPGIFARLRSWALNLIRLSGAQHIYASRQTFGWDAQAAWNCLTAHDEK